MRAVVFTGAGGNEVIAFEERPDPVPSGSDVLVAVRYAGLNPADLAQREGRYPAPPGSPPDIPGLEVVGLGRRGRGRRHSGSGPATASSASSAAAGSPTASSSTSVTSLRFPRASASSRRPRYPRCSSQRTMRSARRASSRSATCSSSTAPTAASARPPCRSGWSAGARVLATVRSAGLREPDRRARRRGDRTRRARRPSARARRRGCRPRARRRPEPRARPRRAREQGPDRDRRHGRRRRGAPLAAPDHVQAREADRDCAARPAARGKGGRSAGVRRAPSCRISPRAG